jgi:hypothetical protein
MTEEAVIQEAGYPGEISNLYPPLDLRHLKHLTDASGIIQHAYFTIPNRRTGYCVDDNSRALLVALQCYAKSRDPDLLRLASTYLSFMRYAHLPDGRFHNFVAYDQSFLDAVGSEDCQGRAVWALGYAATDEFAPASITKPANEMFLQALRWVPSINSPRARCYALMGLQYYLSRGGDVPSAKEIASAHGDFLLELLKRNSSPGWTWFEDRLTYANAVLPTGLICAATISEDERYGSAALAALDFLAEVTVRNGILEPVGSNGWYIKRRRRARFDQQVIDAADMVIASLAAYRWSGKSRYRELARTSFDWFFGRNVHNVWLYDPASGGCYDGLTPAGLNQNQGAESIVCYLLAYTEYVP